MLEKLLNAITNHSQHESFTPIISFYAFVFSLVGALRIAETAMNLSWCSNQKPYGIGSGKELKQMRKVTIVFVS
jgi:hypothetical protein